MKCMLENKKYFDHDNDLSAVDIPFIEMILH